MNISLTKSNVSFGAKLDESDYASKYTGCRNYNGYLPDEFVLSRLKAQPKAPEVIFDLGAGQGRNAIPIAQMGYNKIYACEINGQGRQCIKDKASEQHIGNRIKTLKLNVLDDNLSFREKANFAFMSHVSQHFSTDDLKKFFKNISKNIVNGGELVFDAFVRKDLSIVDTVFKQLFLAGKKSELMGNASFEEGEIVKSAKEAGFKLELVSPFEENGDRRAFYEKAWADACDFTNKIKNSDGACKKPLELMWFVFRK